MEDKTLKEQIQQARDELKVYLEAQLALWKLEGANAVAKLLTIMISALIIGGFALLVLLFLSVMIVMLLAKLVDSVIISLLIITVFNALLGLFFYSRRRTMIRQPMLRKVIKALFPEPGEEDK